MGKHSWQEKSLTAMSLAMTLNFALIAAIIQRHVLGKQFLQIRFPQIPLYLSNVLSFVILFVVPSLLLNYLFIFHNTRYEKLIVRYPNYNGGFFTTYFLLSLFVPVVLLWIKFLNQ
jgi:hypothetical protein